jgi:hypothetical protein
MSALRPPSGTFNVNFSRYVSLVDEADVLAALGQQIASVGQALGNLSEQQVSYAYAPGKWTIAEVIGHVIDCERVFGYRALSIARGERKSLPSFDENVFAKAANHRTQPMAELLEEFFALRRSHVLMFRHFTETAWDRLGLVGEHPSSTRAWAFIMVGHLRHHARVLTERYGVKVVA